MQSSRRLIVLSSVLLASICSATPIRGVANVLPEVKRHLADAHRYLQDGSWQYAMAHADLVLISDTLSIYVNVDHVPAAQRHRCLDSLSAACSVWESALGNTLHFRMESNPAKAGIRVTFRPDVQMGRDAVAGLTKWKRGIRTSEGQVREVTFKADVNVRARGLDSRALSFEAMRQETEHELGHVLGLDDSDFLGDLMGELDPEYPVSAPRDYEIQAVKSLREEAMRVKAEAQSRDSASTR